MTVLLENMTVWPFLASLGLFFQVGGCSTIYFDTLKESRRISESIWSHFSPMHFSMLTTAASTTLKIKSISLSATISVLSGHNWHQFQVPKDKAAPEDKLHPLGPQQDIGYFQGYFFHLSDWKFSLISNETARSVIIRLEIKPILAKEVWFSQKSGI